MFSYTFDLFHVSVLWYEVNNEYKNCKMSHAALPGGGYSESVTVTLNIRRYMLESSRRIRSKLYQFE